MEDIEIKIVKPEVEDIVNAKNDYIDRLKIYNDKLEEKIKTEQKITEAIKELYKECLVGKYAYGSNTQVNIYFYSYSSGVSEKPSNVNYRSYADNKHQVTFKFLTEDLSTFTMDVFKNTIAFDVPRYLSDEDLINSIYNIYKFKHRILEIFNEYCTQKEINILDGDKDLKYRAYSMQKELYFELSYKELFEKDIIIDMDTVRYMIRRNNPKNYSVSEITTHTDEDLGITVTDLKSEILKYNKHDFIMSAMNYKAKVYDENMNLLFAPDERLFL